MPFGLEHGWRIRCSVGACWQPKTPRAQFVCFGMMRCEELNSRTDLCNCNSRCRRSRRTFAASEEFWRRFQWSCWLVVVNLISIFAGMAGRSSDVSSGLMAARCNWIETPGSVCFGRTLRMQMARGLTKISFGNTKQLLRMQPISLPFGQSHQSAMLVARI